MHHFKPVPVLISDRAASTPDAVAVESISTGESFTWAELDRNSRRWAAAYRRMRVEPGEYVVTLMPNTPDALFVWLGATWLRAVEVPINTDYRGEWLTHAINTAQARVIITSRRFAPQLALVAENLPNVHVVVIFDAEPGDEVDARLTERFRVVSGEELMTDIEPADDLAEPNQWDVMNVIYTSGTTGKAKGVLIPWGMQESLRLLYAPAEFHDGGAHYGFWPPFHVLGKSSLLLPAAFGGKLVTRERFSISDFWSDVRKYECTTTYTISVIAGFLQSMPAHDDDADNPLQAVLMGPVIPEVEEFKRRFGVKVYTCFGSTEVGSVLFSFEREIDGSNWRSVGRAPEDSPTEVAVVDPHDVPVGPNTVGELIVRPKIPWTLNVGYANMPEATVRAWRNGWYHTGDAFVYDEDGEYYFVDRAKDYIRRRGENISSFEVEQAVQAFPNIAQAAAVAVPSEVGEDEVMVFVVPAAGATVDPAELCEFLADRVPKFALPRYVEILESMPSTQATFRVQKNKLRERGVGENTYDRVKAQD